MFKRSVHCLVFSQNVSKLPLLKGGRADLRSVFEGVKVGLQFAGMMKETCLVVKSDIRYDNSVYLLSFSSHLKR